MTADRSAHHVRVAFGVRLKAGIPAALYAVFLGLCTTVYVQRILIYSHLVSSLWIWPWHDLNNPEYWMFSKNQVTPFRLATVDGQSLFAWHVLPLPLYTQHEEILAKQLSGFKEDVTATENFRLLKEDPNSRLVIYFHGNAGHIAQSWRTNSYHTLTDTSIYHVLALDYRGFGLSSGHPTEAGLIIDGCTAVHWAIHVAGVPAHRIVLLGHSLGAAVASAVTAHYAARGIDFAGVVLVSAFASLPNVLAEYRFGGLIPALGPLRLWPWFLRRFLGLLADTWDSAERLKRVARQVTARDGRLRMSLVHARDDGDIPAGQDDLLFAEAVNGTLLGTGKGLAMSAEALVEEKKARTVVLGKDAFVATWRNGDVQIRQELVKYGGHNDVMFSSAVAKGVMGAFDLILVAGRGIPPQD